MHIYLFVLKKNLIFFLFRIFFIYFHVIYSVSVPQSTNKPTNHLNVTWITNDVSFSGRESCCYHTMSTTTTTTRTMMIAFVFDLWCDVAWCLMPDTNIDVAFVRAKSSQMLRIFLFIICHKSSPIRIWQRHSYHLVRWFRPKCSSTSKRICPNVLVLFRMIIMNRHRLPSKLCMVFKLERNDWKCNWKNQKMPRSLTKRSEKRSKERLCGVCACDCECKCKCVCASVCVRVCLCWIQSKAKQKRYRAQKNYHF